MLWNPETEEITGIIDWGDIHVGDPALDFTGILYDCGMDFTKLVLGHYSRPVDPTFMFRVDWYGKLLGFHMIEYSQTAGKDWYIKEGLKHISEL